MGIFSTWVTVSLSPSFLLYVNKSDTFERNILCLHTLRWATTSLLQPSLWLAINPEFSLYNKQIGSHLGRIFVSSPSQQVFFCNNLGFGLALMVVLAFTFRGSRESLWFPHCFVLC